MIKFTLPDETNRDDVLDFYAEFERRGESCVGSAGHEDYAAWLRDKRNRSSGENLPEGCVRENLYLCYEGSRLVGVFSLKFELTDYLLNYGGHVGYAVRRSERNRGLAAEMLEQGLRLARSFGLERVLAVCGEDNYAAQKVVARNSGVFENKMYDEKEKTYVSRFWIDLRPSMT